MTDATPEARPNERAQTAPRRVADAAPLPRRMQGATLPRREAAVGWFRTPDTSTDAAPTPACASKAAPLHAPTERQLARHPSSVGQARTFVRDAIVDHVQGDRADDILVCVSELATNALEHGTPPGRDFRVSVSITHDVLRIEVHDTGDGRPEQRTATEDDDAGRGLFLVASFADDWGVSPRIGLGKVVWAEFKLVPAVTSC